MINELSIIIPALNEEKYIGKLLTSIVAQDFQGKLQVIAVDGESQDNTLNEINKFRDKIKDLLIMQTKRGVGFQRNRGVEKAKYKYLLFLDADVILTKNFLQKFLKRIDTQQRFVVTAIGWAAEISDPFSYFVMNCMNLCGLLLCYFDPPITWGGCICTTRENHYLIHGFREELKMAEDLDYGKRSVRDGAKYRFFLYPFVLHSSRRLRKIGRIRLFLFYFYAYFFIIKRYGFETLERFQYPFGDYTDQ